MTDSESIQQPEVPSSVDMRGRQIIVEVVRIAIPTLEAAYLFGSQARSAVHPESDVDVAILSADRVAPDVRQEVQEELSIQLRSDVDVVDLNSASTVMRMQVVTTGLVLFEKEPVVRHLFEMQTLSAYALLNEERAALLEHVYSRGRIYGR